MARRIWLAIALAAAVGCGPKTSTTPPVATQPTNGPEPTVNKVETPVTPKKLPDPSTAKTFTAADDTAVAALKDKPVDELIAGLKDEQQRTISARALAARGSESIAPLVKALEDESPEVRAAAAFALGMLGKDGKEAIAPLEKMAKDDQSEVAKSAAAYALDALQGN